MRKILGLLVAAIIAIPTTFAVAAPAEAATYAPHLVTHSNQHNFNRKTVGAFVIQVTARYDSGSRMAGRAYLYIGGDKTRALTLNQGRVKFKISRGSLPNNKATEVKVRIDPRNGDIRNRNVIRTVIDRKSSSSGSKVVQIAMDQVGDEYQFGKAGPHEFDCSGLVKYVYRHATGKNLPHSSAAQRYSGTKVRTPRPGDLVYTKGHISIYAGNGKVIEAANERTGVRYTARWQKNPAYIRP